MAALDTFDWFKREIWPALEKDVQIFLEQQRDYLLGIRNENERRRFVEELMTEMKKIGRKK